MSGCLNAFQEDKPMMVCDQNCWKNRANLNVNNWLLFFCQFGIIYLPVCIFVKRVTWKGERGS